MRSPPRQFFFHPFLLTALRLRSDRAHRHLRGRLPCAVKPIGPHRASEYALHLSGTAFGLLGVMLEGLRGSRHRLPPPRAVPQPVSSCLQIDLRESFGTATLPTGTSVPIPRGEAVIYHPFATATLPTGTPVASPRAEQSNNLSKTGLKPDLDRSSTRRPCPQAPQGYPRVARGSYDRSSARPPCLQVPQGQPHVAKMVFYLRLSMK